MSNYKRITLVLFSSALAVTLFSAFLFSAAQASDVAVVPGQPDQAEKSSRNTEYVAAHMVNRYAADLIGQGVLIFPTTTLSISNLSTIWALVDKQDPATGPRVFVVEAEVVNTGSEPAEMVSIVLNYNEDPANDWILLPGEEPTRSISSLMPGESYYAYWFVGYPAVENLEHEYTLSALADNAEPVTTNKSVFDTPALTKTVKTLEFQRTGNTGQGLTDVEALVGVAYTITVNYDLGQNPDELIFGPVGNFDFDPSATRLLSTTVSFQNLDGSQRTDIDNQLYFPSLPKLPNGSDPTRAVTTYKMVALKPAETRLCAYTGVRTNSDKYDKDYCTNESVIIISGTSSMALLKSASSTTVIQNGFITYTLDYTNSGNVGIPFAWIWDEIDPTIGSIVASTSNPAPDPVASDENLVAWNLNNIPAAGQPGSSGTLTLTVEINGGGQVMTDGMPIVNSANFGISPSGLPSVEAITSTITSTLQAPAVTIEKSDGLTSVGAGNGLTYTISLQNNGSALATGLVVTDLLPSGVVLASTPTPDPDGAAGNVLEWFSSTLGDLQPNGGMLTLTIPISVNPGVGYGTILTNMARVKYQNSSGFVYPEQVAEDLTTVVRPLAVVDGYAFDDLNGDGIFNGGESGLANVQVSLPSAMNPLILTGGDGYYLFTIENEGPISVTTSTPSGYFHTTPGTVFLDSTLGLTQTIDFGFASNGADFGVLFGTVFEDSNKNGFQQIGENGLNDVVISSAGAITTPVMSDGFGRYTLKFDSSGPTAIVETNPPGWVSTTPDVVSTLVGTGTNNNSPINFGDFQGIKITGMVFEDANVNGANDGESGLAGAVIEADGSIYTTGASGVYTIYVSSGTQPITVTETNPGGYVSTNAVPVSGTNKIDDDTLVTGDPQSGSVFIGDFGDVRPADLSILKSVNSDIAAAGTTITFSLTFTNYGQSNSQGITIADELPDGLTFGQVVNQSASLTGPNQSGQTITWSLESLASNESGFINFTATLSPNLEESIIITNMAMVSANTPDLEMDNNESSVEVAVIRQSDLAVEKMGEPPLVIAGEQLTYTVEVFNYGPSDAGGVTVFDDWPADLIYLSADSSLGNYDPDSGVWSVGDLTFNSSAILTIVAKVDPGSQITITNVVTVTAEPEDLVDSNNQSLVETAVRTSADLSIVKYGLPDPVAPGGTVTYTLVFTNNGPSDATAVIITDTLDSDVKFGGVVTANVPLNGPSVTGQLVSWEMSTFAAGEVGTLIYTATVHPATAGSITNEVQISAGTPDPDQKNNQSETLVTVGDPGVGTIYGYVFTDNNGNGQQDSGEAGIEGVSVSLDGAYTATTDVDGLFIFLTGIAGVHNVIESQPGGYFSTTPDEVHVAVILGNGYLVYFGEAPDDIGFASIFGTVFEDADSSQSWDFEEVGLKGVTVTLDMVTSVETGLYGQFTFSTTVTGEHTAIETDPEFYFSTTPNTVTVELALNSSEEVNFGDVRVDVATCDADEFEEDDQYTEANDLPFGQEQAHDFCDDAVDWLKVMVTAGQSYTFTTASWGQRADTFLALFDEDGKSLLAANDDMEGSTDYSSQIKWLATGSGEIFVRVTNRAALEGYHSDYRIWAEEEKLTFLFLPFVTVEPTAQATNDQSALFSLAQTKEELISPMVPTDPLGVIDHSCPDSYEADDTWQLAKPIIDGLSQWHSFDSDPVKYSADKDFASFEVLSGQEITFTVSSNLGVGVLLEVYDKSGNMLGLTGTDYLFVSGLQSGQYFLSASPIGLAYSCVEDEGYELLAVKEEFHFLLIPAMVN